jgi:hypothetical protein
MFQDVVNLTLIPAGELALRPDGSRNYLVNIQ